MTDPRVNWRITATDNVTKTLRGIESRFQRVSAAFKTIGGLVVGAGVLRSLQAVGRATLEWGDKLDDLSQRTGIAQETLAGLEYAAGQTGGTLESVSRAVVRLARSTDDAKRGLTEYVYAFDGLQLSADELSRLPLDEQFFRIADALANVDGEARQLALGQRILGRGFAELLPSIKNGSGELRKFFAEYQRLGGLNSQQIKSLGDANDAWNRLTTAIGNVAKQAIAPLADDMEKLANSLAFGIGANADRAADGVKDLSAQFSAMANVLRTIEPPTWLRDLATIAWDSLIGSLKGVADAFVILAGAAGTAGSVLSEFVAGNIGDDLDKERLYIDRYVRSVRELLGLRVELSDTPKGPQGPRTGFSDAQRLERDIRRSMEQAAGSIDIQAPDLDAILDAAKKAQEAAKAMATEAAAIYDRTRTPLEEYGRDVARVTALHAANAISAETASREIQRLGAVLGQGVQSQVEATDAGQSWARQQQLIADVTESSLTPFDRLAQKYKDIADAERAGLDPTIGAKARAAALAELAATADQTATLVNDRTVSLLDSIRSATEGYARDITDIFFDTTNSIGDMFSDLLNRISRMIVEQQLVRPVLDSLMGSLSGLFGSDISEIDISKLPKRRALGGPVAAGEPYLVGERGPELFMPQQSGQIVPNGSAVGAALNITFQVNSLDPNSAAAVIAGNERVITNVVRRAMVRAGYTPTL